MSLDRAQLLSIALDHWPSFKDYSQGPSPEDKRRFMVCEQRLQEHSRWRALLKDLGSELTELRIGDYTGPGPCFCCVAYPPKNTPPGLHWVVVGCVSFLAPVYSIYAVQFDYSDHARAFEQLAFWPLPPETQATANIIARKIEAAFAVTALPHEWAQMRVPLYVQFTEPPETTLFHALFLDNPENLP